MFVFLVLLILNPNDTLRGFYEDHEDLSSCKVVLGAIKFKEKPSSVKWTLKVSFFYYIYNCRAPKREANKRRTGEVLFDLGVRTYICL